MELKYTVDQNENKELKYHINKTKYIDKIKCHVDLGTLVHVISI